MYKRQQHKCDHERQNEHRHLAVGLGREEQHEHDDDGNIPVSYTHLVVAFAAYALGGLL